MYADEMGLSKGEVDGELGDAHETATRALSCAILHFAGSSDAQNFQSDIP
jgi:hypothetical protein